MTINDWLDKYIGDPIENFLTNKWTLVFLCIAGIGLAIYLVVGLIIWGI